MIGSKNQFLKTDQLIMIENRFLIGTTITYNLMKQVYGDKCLTKPTVKQWHKDYSKGHETVELASHRGSKPTAVTQVNINMVGVAIEEGHHTSTRSLEATLHIPKSSIHKILTKHLGLRHGSFIRVPHHLTSEQMERRVNACNKNLQRIMQGLFPLMCHHMGRKLGPLLQPNDQARK